MVMPLQFKSDELNIEHWKILLKPPTAAAGYVDNMNRIIKDLHNKKRLTFTALKQAIEDDDTFEPAQHRAAQRCLRFAGDWINDEREYQWDHIFAAGTLTVFDLRSPIIARRDALRLCLILTDMVRQTSNGVNKTIVFDEAHEYVGPKESKDLVEDLENAIRLMRHAGLSFIFATQKPETIPAEITSHLTTRMIFKLPAVKSITFLQGLSQNLVTLPRNDVTNLATESGECFLQSDEDSSDFDQDRLLKKPKRLQVRPRCSQHGGETKKS